MKSYISLMVLGLLLVAAGADSVFGASRKKSRRRRVAKKGVPVRIDAHLTGGIGKAWAYQDDLFGRMYIVDIDGKVLVDKKRVKHKIPKKYRSMVGDEIYIGHMFIPNTFAFAAGPGGG